MRAAHIILLVLSSFRKTNCDVELKIFRVIDDNYSPVSLGVEERVGNNLTLTCDLSTTDNYDDQIIWGKATPEFSFKNKTDLEQLASKHSKKLYSMVRPSDLNRAEKRFTPLRAEDGGTYFCGSLKYMKFEVVYIVVKDSRQTSSADQAYRSNLVVDGNIYCNEKMFKCKSNNACINQHYVCDKKPDCKDGSDESLETCKGDPCKDKLQCNDGRCIPLYWCCDKYYDVECNVTYRPTCCQLLSETYEELEYGYIPYNMTEVRTNRTSYIFVSLCILATVFSIVLMLLILSKVFLFAKKTSICSRNQQIFQLEERGRQYRSNIPYNYRNRNILSNVRFSPGGCPAIRTDAVLPSDLTSGTVDALLILSDEIIRHGDTTDRPPSYSDVMGHLEPPPPYSSQDCLNRT